MAKHKFLCIKDIFSDDADPTNSKNPLLKVTDTAFRRLPTTSNQYKDRIPAKTKTIGQTKSPVLLHQL